MGSNKRNKFCKRCGNPTFTDLCKSCSGLEKFERDPELKAKKLAELKEGRKAWRAKLHMDYLKTLMTDKDIEAIGFTPTQIVVLAKIAYKAYQRGDQVSYQRGYMAARRGLEGRWTALPSERYRPGRHRKRRHSGASQVSIPDVTVRADAEKVR